MEYFRVGDVQFECLSFNRILPSLKFTR